jgi:hypothetical protein
VTFEDDSDGTGKLTVEASANGFCGVSAAYFGVDELIAFAERLAACPLPDDPAELAGGFWMGDLTELEQELVGIAATKVGGRGQLGVLVHLRTEGWNGDDPRAIHEVRLQLLTSYPRLDTFRRDLAEVALGQAPEAVLLAEVF